MRSAFGLALTLVGCASSTHAAKPCAAPGAPQHVANIVQWEIEAEDDHGTIVSHPIGDATGAIELRKDLTQTQCTYDAVEHEKARDVRWIRCHSGPLYVSTLAACSSEPMELKRGDADHSVVVLRGAEGLQFGIGVRCTQVARKP